MATSHETARQLDAEEGARGLTGACIAGKYLVERVVDETEFSVVYRATHHVWQRPVAIKVFKASHVSADTRHELLAYFVREGALLAELSERCSAVCQARDIGSVTTPDGTCLPYFVLEWLDGETLEVLSARERANGTPPRRLGEVIRLLTPIAEALALAHSRGVVHCDVKPGNMMLVRDALDPCCRCKLLDFGIARSARGGVCISAGIVERSFTPAYGAPEQFDSSYGPTGPWTDVFGLALVAVELLSGQPALRGDDVKSFAAHACDWERRPTPRASGVPVGDEVEQVFLRALEVDPLKRYADATAFWVDLQRAAKAAFRFESENLPILLARKLTHVAPARSTVRRVAIAVWIVAAAIAILPGIAHPASPQPAPSQAKHGRLETLRR